MHRPQALPAVHGQGRHEGAGTTPEALPAAAVQLSVPVLATLGGILWLGEAVSPRLVLASVAILGGIALVILEKKKAAGVAPR